MIYFWFLLEEYIAWYFRQYFLRYLFELCHIGLMSHLAYLLLVSTECLFGLSRVFYRIARPTSFIDCVLNCLIGIAAQAEISFIYLGNYLMAAYARISHGFVSPKTLMRFRSWLFGRSQSFNHLKQSQILKLHLYGQVLYFLNNAVHLNYSKEKYRMTQYNNYKIISR